MKALRAAMLAAVLSILTFAQSVTLPGLTNPNVSASWLYYNKMRWAGAWSSLVTYNPQDVVTSAGYTYVSLSVANLNHAPAPGGTVYWTQLPVTSGGWGAITGTLSAQSDLNTALGLKEPTITAGTAGQYWRGDKSWQTLSVEPPIAAGTSSQYWRGDKGWQTLNWTAIAGSKQGNTNVPHMAGTNSGVTGAALCNDASGNTTTSGCAPSLPAGSPLQYLRIQPDTGNSTTYQFAALPIVNAADYNFAAQTPGGSLTAGSNTITLAPGPPGVTGSATGAWLYLSGGSGSGSNEAVPITGGTCNGTGQATCTIIVTVAACGGGTCHSGAWTIGSATAGGAEAYWAAGGTSAQVQIQFLGGGAYHFKAPLTINGASVCLAGGGKTATTIVQDSANVDAVQFTAGSTQGGNSIRAMQIALQASSTSGSAIVLNNQAYFSASDLLLFHVPSGITLTNSVWVELRNVAVAEINAGNGLLIGAGGNNTVMVDHFVTTSSTPCNASIRMIEAGDTILLFPELVNCTYGLEMQPGNGQNIASTTILGGGFDHNASHGFYVHGAAGSTVYKTRCTQCWFSSTGDGFRTAAGGGTYQGFSFIDSQFLDNGGYGANIAAGSTYLFEGSRIMNNNGGVGILLGIAAPQFVATGNVIGNNADGTMVGVQQYGIYAGAGLGAGSKIDNINVGNTVADLFLPTGSYPGVSISGVGYDDQYQTIASGTTITPNPSWTPNLKITGTTTITTLTATRWTGRRIRLYKTDAGSVTVGGGGNIPLAHTLVSNGSLDLVWDGSNWY